MFINMFHLLFILSVFVISTFVCDLKYVLAFTFGYLFAFVNLFTCLHVLHALYTCFTVVVHFTCFLPVNISFFLLCYLDYYLVFTCFLLVLPFEPFTFPLDVVLFVFCFFLFFVIFILLTVFYVFTCVDLFRCFIFLQFIYFNVVSPFVVVCLSTFFTFVYPRLLLFCL